MLVTFDSKTQQNGRKNRRVEENKSVSGESDDSNEDVVENENNMIRIIESSVSFNKSKMIKRSKNGCLTCKIRKKKCDENRPNCADCSRLNKNCIWIDDNMSEDDVRILKERVEKEESISKLRKRKGKVVENTDAHCKDKNPQKGTDIRNSYAEFDSKLQLCKTSSAEDALDVFQLQSPQDIFKRRKVSSEYDTITDPITEYQNSEASLSNPLIHSNHLKSKNEFYLDEENNEHLDNNYQLSPSSIIGILKDLSQNIHNHNEIKEMTSEDRKPSFRDLMNNFNFAESFAHNPDNLFNDYINNIKSFYTPSPSPSLSIMPDIPHFDPYLYNYYVEVLSNKASISPSSQNESNSYQKVFLPLAQKDKGVLYGILAWSAFHLGGKWVREGLKYTESALCHLTEALKAHDEDNANSRQTIITNLATLLILCGVEICRGDVKNWSVYLNWGWKLLCKNGGILNFNTSKEEYWLVSNFAYHDILASRSTRRATYFPSEQYDVVFKDVNGFSKGNLNPLLGVCKGLYKIIGDINMLALDLQERMEHTHEEDEEKIEDLNYSYMDSSSPQSVSSDLRDTLGSALDNVFRKVIEKSRRIETELDSAKPDSDDLLDLTLNELELQLTLFEAFQLSAKLYLKQSVLKCNPSMLECRVLNKDLLNCLDILLGSPVQSSLVFPIFIAGIHCITPQSRDLMRSRIKNFIDSYGPWNVQRIGILLDIIWERYNNGNTVVDWHALLEELNWDISFA